MVRPIILFRDTFWGWAWISRKWQTAIAGPAVPARMGHHRKTRLSGGRRTQRQPGWFRSMALRAGRHASSPRQSAPALHPTIPGQYPSPGVRGGVGTGTDSGSHGSPPSRCPTRWGPTESRFPTQLARARAGSVEVGHRVIGAAAGAGRRAGVDCASEGFGGSGARGYG